MPRGFILQPTYRIENGQPVVTLYGKLESGHAFVVRDDRLVPHFYVRRRDAERASALNARVTREEPAKRTMRGDPVARVDVTIPADTPMLRDKLIAAGITCFEADVRFAYRYLIDKGIRGSLVVEGDAASDDGPAEFRGLIFQNPKLRPGEWVPTLSVLSFDIETDPKAKRLLSIALVGCGVSEVLLFTPEGYSCPAGATPFATERGLLQAFVDRVRDLDPDVITGWNVVDFDLEVLRQMASRWGVHFALGRGKEAVRIRPAVTPRGSGQAIVEGRVVLDGIELLRGAFVRMESYSLNAVAQEVLGKEKTITGPRRAEEILRAFQEDRPHLVEYNRNDAQLVMEILEALRLVELTVQRSLLTGMPPDRVAASIASFDFLYLSELARRGIVAPTVRASTDYEAQAGGHVLEPEPGLYRNVLVFDFKSLYPSIIRTFQIDPLGYFSEPSPEEDPIVAPNGAAFRREPGILPGMLDELFPRREEAKAAGDEVASQAIKILMNSFYGVLGTSACRFASPALANAITGFGREILLWSKARVEQEGYRVLYGDTDSLFVLSGLEDAQEASRLGRELAEALNAALTEYVQETWRVESRLELEFERLYLRLFLPAMRGSAAGARKRYAGWIEEQDEGRVVFTGMEVVRRDWTSLAKQVQQTLYERLFTDQPVEDYLRGVVRELREGRLDAHLVYRKGLGKKLESYTASTPPHVAAARKLQGRHGRVIDYVITENGPEPTELLRSPIDYEHYVQRQVRPVAEPVLGILGLEFDKVVGDDNQLQLF